MRSSQFCISFNIYRLLLELTRQCSTATDHFYLESTAMHAGAHYNRLHHHEMHHGHVIHTSSANNSS